jgi:hypothetical protein
MRRRAIIECRERARVSAVQRRIRSRWARSARIIARSRCQRCELGLDPVAFHLRAAVTVKLRTFKHDPLGSSEQIFGEK